MNTCGHACVCVCVLGKENERMITIFYLISFEMIFLLINKHEKKK